MQVLKKEVRQRIRQKAADEFLEHGYERASMRSIARKSGISVGNLYNYYRSKEDLFYSLTRASYSHLRRLLDTMRRHGQEEGFENRRFAEAMIENIAQLLKMHRVGFLLMTDRGQGTRYGNLRETLIGLLAGHFEEELSEDKRPKDSVIMVIAAKNIVDGLIEIARNNRDDEWVDSSVDGLMEYHLHGISGYYA